MHIGTIILAIALAVLVFYFLGFKMLLWAIVLTIIITIIAFFYPIFVDEGWIPEFRKLPKKIWGKYKKWESKLFKWIDSI